MNEIEKTLILFCIVGGFIFIPTICICYNKYLNKQKNNDNYIIL